MGNTLYFVAERKESQTVSLRRFKLSRSDAKQIIQIEWCITNCFDMDEEEVWNLYYTDNDNNKYLLKEDQDVKAMLMYQTGSKRDPVRLKVETM